MSRRDCIKSLILGLAFLSPIGWEIQIRSDPRGTGRQDSAHAPTEIFVAAAADLKFAMEEMIQEFQKDHPEIIVKVTYGSSGNFYSQLSNQAPFDLFFSADIGYPRKLSEQGLTLPGTEFLYAVGHLVIWVPKIIAH